jgi:hypothetical protein
LNGDGFKVMEEGPHPRPLVLQPLYPFGYFQGSQGHPGSARERSVKKQKRKLIAIHSNKFPDKVKVVNWIKNLERFLNASNLVSPSLNQKAQYKRMIKIVLIGYSGLLL